MPKRSVQLNLLKPGEKAFGGSLMTKRKGRGSRPLATKSTMHLVVKSTKATGQWSFNRHHKKIWKIVEKFGRVYGIRLVTRAHNGNHLHMQIQLANRHTYKPFIRAITSAIAMAVTGYSRWNKPEEKIKFWDRRPFTRIVIGLRAFLGLQDYIRINELESDGHSRDFARMFIRKFPRRASLA